MGLQFADPGDRQEFNALSCVTQGKQETEASSLTPSWLQVKPGGTPLTPRADQRAAPGETRVAAARSPSSSLCCPPDSRPSVSCGNMVTHGTSSKPIKRHEPLRKDIVSQMMATDSPLFTHEIGLHVYPKASVQSASSNTMARHPTTMAQGLLTSHETHNIPFSTHKLKDCAITVRQLKTQSILGFVY